MTKTTILSLVAVTGWHAIFDNGDGTIFTMVVPAFAAIRERDTNETGDSVVPVTMSDGYWIPVEDGNLLAVCHESELAAATKEWAAYAVTQAERARKVLS